MKRLAVSLLLSIAAALERPVQRTVDFCRSDLRADVRQQSGNQGHPRERGEHGVHGQRR